MTDDTAKTTVYVDVEDDISTIIGKVEDAAKSIVALVLPKRSTVLQSTVNMRLLKANAESSGKKVVLITSEDALLPLAGAVGLPVSKNLQSAPEIPSAPAVAVQTEAATEAPTSEQPYTTSKVPIQKSAQAIKKEELRSKPNASVGALAEAHERKEPEVVELGDEEPAEAEPTSRAVKAGSLAAGAMARIPGIKVPNFDRFRKWIILGGGGFIALIIFLFLATSVLPKAHITINTEATPVSLNLNLSATGGAKKLDETSNIIPSSVQTYKQTATQKITATGSQDIGSKATGTISIRNCQDSTKSYSVAAGTIFTGSGNNYATTQAYTIPQAVFIGSCQTPTVTVDVIATAGGTAYNQAATSYTSDALPGNFIMNGSAMTGGTSKVVTVVSQQDLNGALTAISNDTTQPKKSDVTDQFKSKLDAAGYYLIESTLKVSKPTASSSPAVGQPATDATVTVTTTYSVLALKKSDLTKAITDYAKKQIDTTKQTIDTTDILSQVTVDVANQISTTDAALSVSGSVNAVPAIDANTVKSDAAGKKKGDIQATISSWPGVKSVTIKLSPFWVSKVPGSTGKIIVTIQAASGN